MEVALSELLFSFDKSFVFLIDKDVLPLVLSFDVLVLFEKSIHFAEVKLIEFLAFLLQIRAKIAYFGKDFGEFRDDNEIFWG